MERGWHFAASFLRHGTSSCSCNEKGLEHSAAELGRGFLTVRVFANEVILGGAPVVIPLEQVGAPDAGGRRRLVVHDHADLAAAGGLVRVPVPAGKGATVGATGEGQQGPHSLGLPVGPHCAVSLRFCLRTRLREGGRTLSTASREHRALPNGDLAVGHLTFATAPGQGGLYI